MYLWVPQVVAAAGKNIDCDLSGSIPTLPTQVGIEITPSACLVRVLFLVL